MISLGVWALGLVFPHIFVVPVQGRRFLRFCSALDWLFPYGAMSTSYGMPVLPKSSRTCSLVGLLLLCVVGLSSGEAAPGHPEHSKEVYTRLCVGCHGGDGQGGRMTATLAASPRNLTDQAYMHTKSDQQLFDVITQGGAATGLSPVMPAFGTQITSQEIWDLVAYIRTFAQPSESRQPTSGERVETPTLGMARLRLSIWPEYDDPRVLVILRGEMTPPQAFPTQIQLPLPKGAEVIGAGMVSERNELLLHPYEVQTGEAQDRLQLSLPVSRFFVEFYYNPLTERGGEKRFLYTAAIPYALERLEVEIQQPLQASNFRLEPPAMGQRTDDRGFTYHDLQLQNLSPGQPFTFTITYTKTASAPSVPKPQASTQPEGVSPPVAPPTLMALGILAGVSVLFGLGAWMWRRQRGRHTPSAPSAGQSTTASAVITWFLTAPEESDASEGLRSSHPSGMPQYCTQCGRKRVPRDHFCAGCGQSLRT